MSDVIQVPAGLTTAGLLGQRYLARFIDSLIIGALALMVLSLSVFGPVVGPSRILLNFFALLILWIGYGALLESSQWQATLGKRLMGLRVYDSEGGRLKLSQAAGRNLLKEGPFLLFALTPGASLLSGVWIVAQIVVLHQSSVYQAIHDRVAKTWVGAPETTTQLHLT
jgi:uncharacterized RDD family membrane protein YckC